MKKFLRNTLLLAPISICLFFLLLALFRFLSPAQDNGPTGAGNKDAVLGEVFRPTTNYPGITAIPRGMVEVLAATPTPEIEITATPQINRSYTPRYNPTTPVVSVIPTTITPVITSTPIPTLTPVSCSSDVMVQATFIDSFTCRYETVCRDIVIKPYLNPAHSGTDIYWDTPEFEKFGYALRKDFIEGALVLTVLKVRENASFFYRLNWNECQANNCSACSLDFTLDTGSWDSGSCFYTSGVSDSCEYYPDLNNIPAINN